MLKSSPYQDLESEAFWRTGVTESSPSNPTGVYAKKWDIPYEYKIATAGSCFAQHISRELKKNGFNVLDLEPAPVGLPERLHSKFGFSMYSCRYGNIYTAQQLLQLAREVVGDFKPEDIAWERAGRYYDALRPAVEPKGFDSVEVLSAHRAHHLLQVKKLFSSMDLFIFTLGLTEAWEHRESGTVFPTAPGVIAGIFDENKYTFRNYNYNDVINAFEQFMQILIAMRKGSSLPKFLLTVSPVPLTATASGKHVLQATTYSKSVLRAVSGELSNDYSIIDYFPSYEIITNQAARSHFYESNLRSVRPEGVEAVMNVFFSEHKPRELSENLMDFDSTKQPKKYVEKDNDDVQCEEAVAEVFNP